MMSLQELEHSGKQCLKEITWSFNGLCNGSMKNYHLYHVIRHDLCQHWTAGSQKFRAVSRFSSTAFTLLNTHICVCTADMEQRGLCMPRLRRPALHHLPSSNTQWTLYTSSSSPHYNVQQKDTVCPEYHHIPM